MNKSKYDYKPLEIKWLNKKTGELDKRKLIDGCQYDTVVEMAIKESDGRLAEIWVRDTTYTKLKPECIWKLPKWDA